MLITVRMTEAEIKEAIAFYFENGPPKKKIKKSVSSLNEGEPDIYLGQGGSSNSGDPREHAYIYAECKVETT